MQCPRNAKDSVLKKKSDNEIRFINELEWEWSDLRRQHVFTSHHYSQIKFIYNVIYYNFPNKSTNHE